MKNIRVLSWNPGVTAANYDRWLGKCGARVVWVNRKAPLMEPPLNFDALLLPGGRDINPRRYGDLNRGSNGIDPVREKNEFGWTNAFLEAGKPVLGICRGIQTLNVALGGTLIQDIAGEPPDETDEVHQLSSGDATHEIRVLSGTRLREMLGADRLSVNSSHHQSVKKLGRRMKVSAESAGGVIEAVEMPEGAWVFGVQWHPERLPADHPASLRLVEAFIRSARA